MNAPFSLEHTGPAVTPLYTLTPSALSTWVWEEGRVVGAAVDWWRVASNGMRFNHLFGSGFSPDPMGRLLALRAVMAAAAMLKELQRFNAEEGRNAPLCIGIDIATGPVIAGNVGSPQRLTYTVLGDMVNLASRLQGLTKECGAPLLGNKATYPQVSTMFTWRLLGEAAVRGRQQAITLYTRERRQQP